MQSTFINTNTWMDAMKFSNLKFTILFLFLNSDKLLVRLHVVHDFSENPTGVSLTTESKIEEMNALMDKVFFVSPMIQSNDFYAIDSESNEDFEWIAFFLNKSIQSLITCPFHVLETISQCQIYSEEENIRAVSVN